MTEAGTNSAVEKLIEPVADANAGKWVVTYGDAFDGIGVNFGFKLGLAELNKSKRYGK